MNNTQKEEFKRHRKQQLQLKKKRKQERVVIDENMKNEEEMLFRAPGKDDAEAGKLKDQIKKLQEKC